jgi:nicotinamide-nucleotide amidase
MNAIHPLPIGDELVLGQTVDTNSAWISQQLASVGCAVAAHLTVGDDQKAIEQAMLESVGRCDVLIISGGIGPTEDDLTRQALRPS